MSERRYELTARADRELLDLYLYGVGEFGFRQAEDYLLGLRRTFDILAEQPQLGRTAPEIGRNVRRHRHGSHVILYEPAVRGALILAIVHKSSVRGLEI